MKNKENTLGANKQMAFLNTTKLAVALKRTLMVLTLCIISTLCIQAEESTTEPSDSIAMTGPKKSHWTSPGWFGTTTYNNETDYARIEATIEVYDEGGHIINAAEVGSVDISYTKQNNGTDIESTSLLSSTTTAFVNWNSGTPYDGRLSNKDDNIKAKHTLNVTLTITDKGDDTYVFEKWEKKIESVDTPLDPSINPKSTTINDNVVIGGGGTGFTEYGNAQKNTYENTENRYTVTYIAKFVPKQTECNVTFDKARGGGEYTYKNGDGTATTVTKDTVVTLNGTTATTLTALTNEDYNFWAWYVSYDEGATYSILSKTTPYTCTFEKDAIVYAQFIPSDAALFIIKDDKEKKQFWNLNEACEKALSLSLNVVLPKEDGTLYPLVDGELCKNPEGKTIKPYTIPSGVTLLIPYEATYKNSTNEPKVTSGTTKPTKHIQLTLASGCVIDVEGAVCVNAKMTDNQHTNGATLGKSGIINMSEGAKIVLKKNTSAKLYCWGAIVGTGEIVAESSSTVYEAFQSNHYPGGTFLLAKLSSLSNNKIFPMQIYCIPNIQARLKICYGAEEKLASAYATTGVGLQKDIVFITKKGAESGLFKLADEESYVEKWYDRQNDKFCYNLYGGADMEGITIKIASLSDINSTSFVLPMTHNMLIELHPLGEQESTVNITSDIALLPSSKVTVKKNVVVNVNKALYVYDSEQWKKAYAFGVANKSVIYDRSKTTSFDALVDAVLEVDGTIQVEGGLYTTQSAADICSNGSGKIKYINAVGTMPKLMQMKQTSSTAGETEAITITAAQLHNDESKTWNQDEKYKYTPTAGAVANDVFTYSETYGRWRCERTVTWEANGGTIEPLPTIMGKGEPLSLYFPESLPTPTRVGYTFNGWFTAASDGEQITTGTIVNNNVTYYAQWTLNIVGTPLDIVDADGTNLTINTNGWASSIWSYTINDIPYEKNARQEDRTLVIPYSGDPNDDMPIVVKNESDEVISNHMYKVPFVYTSDATMSGTNENSIVFVKSGTLSIEGTASAKEIYVAPGAELKVNENSTLNVEKLVLRTTPYKAAILTNNGTINGQVFYSRISPNSGQYYQFGLPLSCELANVKMSNTGKLGGSQPKYGTAWILKSYSESLRANNGISNEGANWSLLPSNGTITAGVGYEMFSNSNYYREFYFPVDITTATTQVSVQYTDGTIGAEHNGWNIITSPLTSRANVPIIDPATGIKVCWLNKDGSYRQKQDTVIPPAIPFSIQTSAEGKLNFAIPTIAAAPRKQSAAEALTETEWVHLDIFDAYGEGDETSLFVHPTRFEQTYKTGIDVAKQSLTAARPIIYSTHAYGDMAFAGIADSLLENGIDLVVYSPSAQELTFSLRENKFLHRLEYLWLADNETGARTDLLMDDYTYHANAGTIKGRFVLNGRFKAPQIATGIGNTQTDYNIYAIGNNIAISGVEQGTAIYVFDAVGHMIYTTSATSDEVIVPVPCAGVYMLSVGGQTAKLVINK